MKPFAFLRVTCLSLLLTACSLVMGTPPPASPSSPTPDVQQQVDQAVAATLAVQTQIAAAVQETLAALDPGSSPATATTEAPQAGATASLTQPMPPTATATPPKVMVSVNLDTNCRAGPGTTFVKLGVMRPGEMAEVVARSMYDDNWIIRLPSNPAVICWLWGQYATVTGDWQVLPKATPPPTPTSPATITSTKAATITLTIFNNCGSTIWYAFISDAKDPAWGQDRLGSSTIPPSGSYSWVIDPGLYDVKVEDAGHNVLFAMYGLSLNGSQQLVACP